MLKKNKPKWSFEIDEVVRRIQEKQNVKNKRSQYFTQSLSKVHRHMYGSNKWLFLSSSMFQCSSAQCNSVQMQCTADPFLCPNCLIWQFFGRSDYDSSRRSRESIVPPSGSASVIPALHWTGLKRLCNAPDYTRQDWTGLICNALDYTRRDWTETAL